jgi:hypothetical protein
VSKLKELGKHVIGLGMQPSTSDLLRDNCDEFIYYEDLGQQPVLDPVLGQSLPEAKLKVFGLLMESLLALRRENKSVLWSSMIKDTMKRKKTSFNESYHGYRTFSELLEDARDAGLVELDMDARSRSYVVTRFGAELERPKPTSESGDFRSSRNQPARRRRGDSKRPVNSAHHSGNEPLKELPVQPPVVKPVETSVAIEEPAMDKPALVQPEPNADDDILFTRGPSR